MTIENEYFTRQIYYCKNIKYITIITHTRQIDRSIQLAVKNVLSYYTVLDLRFCSVVLFVILLSIVVH